MNHLKSKSMTLNYRQMTLKRQKERWVIDQSCPSEQRGQGPRDIRGQVWEVPSALWRFDNCHLPDGFLGVCCGSYHLPAGSTIVLRLLRSGDHFRLLSSGWKNKLPTLPYKIGVISVLFFPKICSSVLFLVIK